MTVELVHRALNGDVDAFDALVAGRIEQMVRLAMANVGNEADARDATQDALAAIWRELPSLRQPERFAAWADRILVNRCRLTLKRRGRRAVREFALPSDDPPGVPTASGPEGDVLRRQALQTAFEELDADARALLVLHHLAELPLVEIAARLGIPVGTAKSRLHAARQRLARALESELDDEIRAMLLERSARADASGIREQAVAAARATPQLRHVARLAFTRPALRVAGGLAGLAVVGLAAVIGVSVLAPPSHGPDGALVGGASSPATSATASSRAAPSGSSPVPTDVPVNPPPYVGSCPVTPITDLAGGTAPQVVVSGVRWRWGGVAGRARL